MGLKMNTKAAIQIDKNNYYDALVATSSYTDTVIIHIHKHNQRNELNKNFYVLLFSKPYVLLMLKTLGSPNPAS